MTLYFRPLACSMATRILLYEGGADAAFVRVGAENRLPDGGDLRDLNPLGLVPTLRTDDGEILTENGAILPYVAERVGLGPSDLAERRWLGFVGTELHKAVFAPQFDKTASDAVKRWALDKAPARLAVLERHLADGRPYLGARFGAADAYLVTVMNWTAAVPLPMTELPALGAWLERTRSRPSVARAIAEELPMYRESRAA